MAVTGREFWLMAHLLLGALFFYFFVHGLAGLVSKSTQRLRILLNGTWSMALISWAVVILGTWVVSLRWDAAPDSSTLLQWHGTAMAWMAPMLATTVAVIVVRYGTQLYRETKVRGALSLLFIIAFLTAAAAGDLGAFISEVAQL